MSSSREKIQAFVQDSLDAHEEFLQKQGLSAKGPDNDRLDSEHGEGKQLGQGFSIEQLQNNEQKQSEIKQSVTEEEEAVHTEQREGENTTVEVLEGEQVQETQVSGTESCRDLFERNQADIGQENQLKLETEQCESKQPPLIVTAPSEPDETVTVHGPGPLVTELDDEEHLEIISLSPHRPLCIDDLPDLEDVDTEDQDITTIFSSQRVSRPKIEIISADSDEDEPTREQIEPTPTVAPYTNSLFFESDRNTPAGVCNKSSSMVDLKAGDALEPQIFELQGRSKTNQASCPPHCLIEELD